MMWASFHPPLWKKLSMAARAPVFRPKLFTCLRGYSSRRFVGDLIAGLTVGVVALPLAMAFGIASIPESVAAEAGVSPPVMGLITAIVAGFLISALGGTRTSIGGPTGAFVVIVYAIAAEHGYGGLVLATMMAGAILVVMGIARMGAMIKFIPYPVTTGFTSGIAVIIFTSQIRDLLGLQPVGEADAAPPEFLGKVHWYITHANTIDWATAAFGLGSVAALFAWKRWGPRRVPGPVLVMVVATVLAHALGMAAGTDGEGGIVEGVATISSRFGAIPSGVPMPRMPVIDWGAMPALVWPATTIAVLAAIESLLCAVVADGMLGTRHRPDTELIAQGAANMACPLFGGIPATGAIARTATNIQSGGRTPVAGIVHALTLLGIVVLFGRYAGLVPLPALAAVLVVVAWNMSEAHRFFWLLRGPRPDAAVLLTTFGLTVFTDLTIAVGVGMVLASMLFIKRMSELSDIRVAGVNGNGADGDDDVRLEETSRESAGAPAGVEVYEIRGAFFFGAAFKLRDTLDQIGKPPRAMVLDVSRVLAIDATGLHAMEELRRRCVRDGTRLILVGVHAGPMMSLAREGLLDAFGTANMVGTVDEAVAMAASGDATV